MEVEKNLTEWIGKEIQFPENFQCGFAGKDTVSTLCSDLFQAEYKILLYVDSAGCIDCELRLRDWKLLIDEFRSLNTDNKLSVLFFFYPKNKKKLHLLFKRNQMDYPFFIDNDNAINQLNHFSKQIDYQCFLLDRNNRVLMMGNPILNHKIWDLYEKQIEGKLENIKELTTIKIDNNIFDFGNIIINMKNETVFSIKNTGDTPLIIQHISTSCGCTAVEWDKKPIEQGETTKIKVEMTPKEEGYFKKTIMVYCNVKELPVKLTIIGRANNSDNLKEKKGGKLSSLTKGSTMNLTPIFLSKKERRCMIRQRYKNN
jgi:hypothetical protein